MSRIVDAGRVFMDRSGNLLGGGTVSFYTNRTLTSKATYSDTSLTTQNNASIRIGSDGRLPVEVFGLGLYTCRAYDANGALAWAEDDLGEDPTVISVLDYGAVGDNATNNDTALSNARTASPLFMYVPAGDYVSSATAFNLLGNYQGPGQIQTTDGPRGNHVVRISAQPSTLANGGGINTFYTNGMASPYNFDIAITGDDTVGEPSSGYVQNDQVHPFFFGMYNSSGHNESLTTADGRTGIAAMRFRITQAGDGDCGAINANGVVTANNPSHTGLYGTPAIVLFNGNISSTVGQVYLNPFELKMDDNNNDVRAVGAVYNLDRDNNTEANGEYWSGIRVQNIGSAASNAAFQAIGSFDVGWDATMATIGSAAIALRDGQNIEFGASSSTVGSTQRVADTFNGGSIGWNTDALEIDGRTVHPTVTTLADDATPSVSAGNLFETGGTTAITDFDDGKVGQTIHIKADHSVTITDGSPIVLSGGTNYAMTAGDTLTLVMFDDQVWHEVSRSVN